MNEIGNIIDGVKPRLVVRVTTYCFHDRKGLHIKKDINILRRKSTGFDFLSEDCLQIGAELVEKSITNLYAVEDGIYAMIITNIQKDWETGYVEQYDYELVPYSSVTDSTDRGTNRETTVDD